MINPSVKVTKQFLFFNFLESLKSNLPVQQGKANLLKINENNIEQKLVEISSRNKHFDNQSNTRFNFTETSHQQGNYILLFEKLQCKKNNVLLFARIKFLEYVDEQRVEIQKTFNDHQFDSQISSIYAIQNANQDFPVFVTVHPDYSKVWECVFNPQNDKFQWQNSFTSFHFGMDVISQTLEISSAMGKNSYSFYSVTKTSNQSSYLFILGV